MSNTSSSLRHQVARRFNWVGGAVLSIYALHYGSSYLLPTDEDIMREYDINEPLAMMLSDSFSDRHVRVRERGPAGTLHSILDGALSFHKEELDLALDNRQAYASRGWRARTLNLCTVTMLDKDINLDDYFRMSYNLSDSFARKLSLSARDTYLLVAFHEFRHCHSANHFEDHTVSEADADIHALRALRDVADDPEIITAWQHYRALHMAPVHDTSLFLRHGVDGKTAEELQDIKESSRAALRAIHYHTASIIMDQLSEPSEQKYWHFYNQLSGDDIMEYQVAGARKALAEDDHLSPYARERVVLYIDAAEYFIPSLRPPQPWHEQVYSYSAPSV